MSLIGNTTEQKIWNFLFNHIKNSYGVAGVMGNFQAESGLKSTNLQNSYNTKFNMTDEEYTSAVDSGKYDNFVYDKAGYGLAQWTFWSLKKGLYDYAKQHNKSIGDLELQLEFFMYQMTNQYTSILNTLKTATSVREASDCVLLKFERPADQSESVQIKRAEYGQIFYNRFSNSSKKKGDNVTMEIIQSICTKNPCYTNGRTIIPKGLMLHSVGCPQPSASVFVKNWNSSSANVCVHAFVDGNNGKVHQTLPWNRRAWHCGSSGNDTHISVEMCEPSCIRYTQGSSFTCSDLSAARKVAKTTYDSAVELFAYLCKLYNLNPLKDGVIVSHAEGHKRGIASNHGDPEHLWRGLGLSYTMNGFRNDVKKAMGGSYSSSSSTTSSSSSSNSSSGNTTSFPSVPFFVRVLVDDLNIRTSPSMGNNTTGKFTGKGKFTITQVSGQWGKLKSDAGWIFLGNPQYCEIIKENASSTSSAFKPYAVKITIPDLNIRKSPSAKDSSNKLNKFTGKGVFTIVEEATGPINSSGKTGKWGLLKSYKDKRDGWICLDINGVSKV